MSLLDKYTKEELQTIVGESNSIREVLRKVGYQTCSGSNPNTLKTKLKEYNISIDHFKYQKGQERNEENIFVKNSTATQAVLRRWYLKGNYTPYICSQCGLEPEWQGKPLTLILDHIDGDNTNHEISNLRWVCPNCNQQLPTTGYKKMRVNPKEKNDTKCLECGKIISKNATYCVECLNKFKRANLPTREELKSLIRILPFTQIGNQFGVSDNAVRKWCDTYKLPRKKSEIQKLTDKQWEEI